MGDETPAELVKRLTTASDADLTAILSEADATDIAWRDPSQFAAAPRRAAPGTVELVLLGALGCRHGMIAGGAGGHMIRTSQTTILIDPGPAALGYLAQLATTDAFAWSELDAVLVSHFHPDHYVDVIPCIEAMATYGTGPKVLAANATTIDRFTAFSPYHLDMVDIVRLAHASTHGQGEPAVKIADLTIAATPAAHTETRGQANTAIGFAYTAEAAQIWYTADTHLSPDLLSAVTELLPDVSTVIAHADASNIRATPERRDAVHLETRDVPAITAALHPADVILQHYDAAYSTARYRIAQAVWLQRRLSGHIRIWPGANGLHLTIADGQVTKHRNTLPDPAHDEVEAYLAMRG